jgi:hypothetical protein
MCVAVGSVMCGAVGFGDVVSRWGFVMCGAVGSVMCVAVGSVMLCHGGIS